MLAQYCQNSKVDVLLITEPYWSQKHEYDLKRINTFLYRLSLLRVVILPMFVAGIWGLYALFGQYEIFLLVLLLAYVALMTLLWSVSRSQVRQVSSSSRGLFSSLIERTVLCDTKNLSAFLGLPLFVVVNCVAMGLDGDEMDVFYALSLGVAALSSVVHVAVISSEPCPDWFDERIEKHF